MLSSSPRSLLLPIKSREGDVVENSQARNEWATSHRLQGVIAVVIETDEERKVSIESGCVCACTQACVCERKEKRKFGKDEIDGT